MFSYDVLAAVKTLQQRQHFLAWQQQHPDAFLASLMLLLTNDKIEKVKFNYGLPENGDLHTFSSDDSTITTSPPLNKSTPSALLIPDNLSLGSALQQAHQAKEKNNGTEQLTKTLIVLHQPAKTDKPVWDITFVTKSPRVIYVQVAADGDVIQYDCKALIDFMP